MLSRKKLRRSTRKSTLGRLGIMKEKFEKALNTKLEFLKKNAEKSEAEIEETIAQLTAQRKSIDTKLNTQADRIKTSNDSTQSLLQSELQVQKNKQIKAFGHEVDGKTADNDLQNSVKKTVRTPTAQGGRCTQQLCLDLDRGMETKRCRDGSRGNQRG